MPLHSLTRKHRGASTPWPHAGSAAGVRPGAFRWACCRRIPAAWGTSRGCRQSHQLQERLQEYLVNTSAAAPSMVRWAHELLQPCTLVSLWFSESRASIRHQSPSHPSQSLQRLLRVSICHRRCLKQFLLEPIEPWNKIVSS